MVLFSSPLQSFTTIRVFSNESVLHIRYPKYWSFSFSISPSNKYSGLISFRMDWLDLLAVQGTLKSLLQHHSPNAHKAPSWAGGWRLEVVAMRPAPLLAERGGSPPPAPCREHQLNEVPGHRKLRPQPLLKQRPRQRTYKSLDSGSPGQGPAGCWWGRVTGGQLQELRPEPLSR